MNPQLPERPTGLGAQVADALRRLIITQELPSGSLLVEGKLAADFNVSRGPIREAIRALTQEGLVDSAARSARVVGLDAHDIDELFTLRESLEILAVTTAVAQHPETLDKLLAGALEEMRLAVEAGDANAFTHADLRFHGALYAAAGHRRLSDVWDQYRPTIENLLLVANLEHADLAPSLISHEDLAGLVAHRDLSAVAGELHSHLNNSRLRVRREYAGA
jgi:GntR family transcriptional regulator of gluconate operon